MKTEVLQRRWGMTLLDVEALRERVSGVMAVQPGKWFKRNGLMVHEYTGEISRHHNLVVNQGLNHTLETEINAGAAITTWFLTGYTDAITPLATFTAAAPGVTEITTTNVAEPIRETYNANVAAGQSIDNVAGPVAQYIADNTFTMEGMFLIGGGTSAFGDTGGTLWAMTVLTPTRAMVALDTLDMTYTFPASAV